MRRIIQTIIALLLLFSSSCLLGFAQGSGEGGNNGGGETRIWTPDLVELWIWWHKRQFDMFSDFAANEDSLQRKQYEDYRDYMKKLAEMDAILFSQYTNNQVPKARFFVPDVAYGGILISDIKDNFESITRMLLEPPVDAILVQMFAKSSVEMFTKFTYLVLSTEKVLRGSHGGIGFELSDILGEFDSGSLHHDNLRDNRFRDDLLTNIIKELKNIQLSLHSLYERMRTAKHALLFKELFGK